MHHRTNSRDDKWLRSPPWFLGLKHRRYLFSRKEIALNHAFNTGEHEDGRQVFRQSGQTIGSETSVASTCQTV